MWAAAAGAGGASSSKDAGRIRELVRDGRPAALLLEKALLTGDPQTRGDGRRQVELPQLPGLSRTRTRAGRSGRSSTVEGQRYHRASGRPTSRSSPSSRRRAPRVRAPAAHRDARRSRGGRDRAQGDPR